MHPWFICEKHYFMTWVCEKQKSFYGVIAVERIDNNNVILEWLHVKMTVSTV